MDMYAPPGYKYPLCTDWYNITYFLTLASICLLHSTNTYKVGALAYAVLIAARQRANQWLKQYLCIWTADDQTTWAQYLSLAEFVHNSWPHDRMTLTPHELLFRVKPLFPLSDEEAKTPDITT